MNDKMKILVPALGRINTKNRDGSEIRFENMVKIWGKEGFTPHIVAPPREEKILKAEKVKAKFYLLPEKITYEEENILIILLIYLSRLVKAFFFHPPVGMDIIYIPSDFLIDLLPGLWWKRKNPRAKVVVCLFLLAPNPFRGYEKPTFRGCLYFLSQRLSFFLFKHFADKVFVLNSLDQQFLESRGLKDKTEVVDMGVALKEFREIPSSVKIYDACFVGRLHPQKGIFELLKIWQIVCQKKPSAKLAVVGGGSRDFKNKFLKAISLHGLIHHVFFLGFKTGEEKIKILKQSKIFVLPSFYESWGMVAVEAMAAGLPVVAYNLPVFEKIFSKGMIKIPIGDHREFAEVILQLLKDENFYQRKVEEAEEQAKVYDWPNVSAREIEILRNISSII